VAAETNRGFLTMQRASELPLSKPIFRVFISSTAIDLQEHRKKVEEALLRLEQLPVEMETFGAKPNDSVTTCCRLAAEADALVAIVGHRYGWVPDASEGGDGAKSITWLEVQAALANDRSVFAFLVDPAADWNRPKEQDQLLEPNADPVKVFRAVRGLQQFKTFLEKRVRDTFTTPDNLQAKVALSLSPWLTDEIRRWDQATQTQQRSGKRSNRMVARQWDARVIHALQPAPHFEGRAEQLHDLQRWWDDPAPADRVLALVAAGGTGKTALIEQTLRYIEGRRRPGGLFVWSFYENQKTEAFLRAACQYFEEQPSDDGGGWLERLQIALTDGKPHLIILDGLERVQSEGVGGRIRGELDEHSVKLLLQSIARGLKQTRAIITTRFDLIDLHSWANQGYRRIMLDDLDAPAARAVLRAWGVHGGDNVIDHLAQSVGCHALSVSVLGSYLGTYWAGDPAHAPDFELDEAQTSDKTASRLARVLSEYAKKLSDPERDLLARLSTFSRGVDISLLLSLAQAGGPVAASLAGCHEGTLRKILGALKQQGLVFTYRKLEDDQYSAHPFLREYFYNLLGVPAHDVHEVIRASLAPGLASRPSRLPNDPVLLDRYDNLIEHTRLAGRLGEAIKLYRSALGEYGHLGLTVGDYDRGARIQTAFLSDRDAFERLRPVEQSFVMYERGLYFGDLGELIQAEAALEAATKTDRSLQDIGYLCVDLRHLACLRWKQGRLREAHLAATESVQVAREHGSADRLSMSYYHLAYVGMMLGLRDDWAAHFAAARRPAGDLNASTGFAIARSSYLELGQRIRVADPQLTITDIEDVIGNCLSRGLLREIPRYQLLLGQLALLKNDFRGARKALADVRSWTDRTHDVEVALGAHILATAIAVRDGHLVGAQAEVNTGIPLAGACGYQLALIDLLLQRATIDLALPEPLSAQSTARRAYAMSTECGYVWGEADALHVMGLANIALGEHGAARGPLEQAADIRKRIEHGGLAATLEALTTL
jgi:tetratricopeptide (TPR) repeat protein